ncbi:Crp/Fnr family transcriptional regulator [Pedobacter heparinus]|uniref:Crp/Fnr family transcriptional regulator n=1 Tax=Pedobacter heparinus TaxID=984 RepID=UPI0029305769|nr:Crp/Fnr family transcriptional regulator [Pedobacter heparinus]
MTDLLSAHIDRHISLSNTQKSLFFDQLVIHTIEKNQFLLRENEVCKYEYFVIKGGLRLYELERSGNEKVFYFGFEDWWITDKYSFLTGKPSLYNLQAIEDTQVLAISKEKLDQLFMDIPAIESYFHKVLQSTFAIWQVHVLLMHKTAAEKYAMFTSMYGSLESRLPQQLIASYLGMTRETLNRIKSGTHDKLRRRSRSL